MDLNLTYYSPVENRDTADTVMAYRTFDLNRQRADPSFTAPCFDVPNPNKWKGKALAARHVLMDEQFDRDLKRKLQDEIAKMDMQPAKKPKLAEKPDVPSIWTEYRKLGYRKTPGGWCKASPSLYQTKDANNEVVATSLPQLCERRQFRPYSTSPAAPAVPPRNPVGHQDSANVMTGSEQMSTSEQSAKSIVPAPAAATMQAQHTSRPTPLPLPRMAQQFHPPPFTSPLTNAPHQGSKFLLVGESQKKAEQLQQLSNTPNMNSGHFSQPQRRQPSQSPLAAGIQCSQQRQQLWRSPFGGSGPFQQQHAQAPYVEGSQQPQQATHQFQPNIIHGGHSQQPKTAESQQVGRLQLTQQDPWQCLAAELGESNFPGSQSIQSLYEGDPELLAQMMEKDLEADVAARKLQQSQSSQSQSMEILQSPQQRQDPNMRGGKSAVQPQLWQDQNLLEEGVNQQGLPRPEHMQPSNMGAGNFQQPLQMQQRQQSRYMQSFQQPSRHHQQFWPTVSNVSGAQFQQPQQRPAQSQPQATNMNWRPVRSQQLPQQRGVQSQPQTFSTNGRPCMSQPSPPQRAEQSRPQTPNMNRGQFELPQQQQPQQHTLVPKAQTSVTAGGQYSPQQTQQQLLSHLRPSSLQTVHVKGGELSLSNLPQQRQQLQQHPQMNDNEQCQRIQHFEQFLQQRQGAQSQIQQPHQTLGVDEGQSTPMNSPHSQSCCGSSNPSSHSTSQTRHDNSLPSTVSPSSPENSQLRRQMKEKATKMMKNQAEYAMMHQKLVAMNSTPSPSHLSSSQLHKQSPHSSKTSSSGYSGTNGNSPQQFVSPSRTPGQTPAQNQISPSTLPRLQQKMQLNGLLRRQGSAPVQQLWEGSPSQLPPNPYEAPLNSVAQLGSSLQNAVQSGQQLQEAMLYQNPNLQCPQNRRPPPTAE